MAQSAQDLVVTARTKERANLHPHLGGDLFCLQITRPKIDGLYMYNYIHIYIYIYIQSTGKCA